MKPWGEGLDTNHQWPSNSELQTITVFSSFARSYYAYAPANLLYMFMGCCNDSGFLAPIHRKKKKIEAAIAEVLVEDLGKLIFIIVGTNIRNPVFLFVLLFNK